MGVLTGDMSNVKTGSNYQFSATKIDGLGATEYTLASIVVDRSSSLTGYAKDLESMLKIAIDSCKKSPRSENLMARVVSFNEKETEIHGFKLLETIDIKSYDNSIDIAGCTSLYDATYNAILASESYGKILTDQDYLVNAIVFVITDGVDNQSSITKKKIAEEVTRVRRAESLESIAVVLVGMNGDKSVQSFLDSFKKESDLDEYIEMGDVSASKLAKLAGYVSKSTTSTSQALGTGGPSKSLSF